MDIRVFKPLSDVSTLENGQLGKINPYAITWTENLYEPGTWSMNLSALDTYAETLQQDNIISVRASNVYLWGIIRGIDDERTSTAAPIIRSGDDLKGYLKQRICLYPMSGGDLEGYDTVQGSTETVMKHYVTNNIVSPSNAKRKIPKFVIAPDQKRGVPDDKYMARFNPLTELLQEVGTTQEIGYQVNMDIASDTMVFDVVQGVDRSAEQSNRPRIIFDVDLSTAIDSRFVSDVENYRNAFYTTKNGARSEAEATTILVCRENEAEPEGRNRYETQIDVSVDDTAVDVVEEMRNLARKEATNFEKDDTFTVELNGNYIYNKDYYLGDFVTIRDRVLRRQDHVQLISVTHTWQGIGYKITGTFGKPRKSNLQLLERQIRTGGK